MVLDSLSFLDLLYAVPVADLAMRVSGSIPGPVSGADWSALAMILVVIVLSWIGLHKNRHQMAAGHQKREPIGEFAFFGWRFTQFMVEVGIIGLYFLMGLYLNLPPKDRAVTLPPEGTLVYVLLGVFTAYLFWDCIDVRLAGDDLYWQARAAAGGAITAGFLTILALVRLFMVAVPPNTGWWVIRWNIFLIGVLYLYRVVQDSACEHPDGRPWTWLARLIARLAGQRRSRAVASSVISAEFLAVTVEIEPDGPTDEGSD